MARNSAAQLVDDEDNFINPEDFNSIDIYISMTNQTTHTEIKNGVRTYGNDRQLKRKGNDERILFVELKEDGFVLEIPSKSCAQGHSITLFFQTRGAKQDVGFEEDCVVADLKKLNNRRDEAIIRLREPESKNWKRFLSIFSSRQEEIFEFFMGVKGQ